MNSNFLAFLNFKCTNSYVAFYVLSKHTRCEHLLSLAPQPSNNQPHHHKCVPNTSRNAEKQSEEGGRRAGECLGQKGTQTRQPCQICVWCRMEHCPLQWDSTQYHSQEECRSTAWLDVCYCQVYVGEWWEKVRELCTSSVQRGWVPRARCRRLLCLQLMSSPKMLRLLTVTLDTLSISRADYKPPTNSRLSELI